VFYDKVVQLCTDIDISISGFLVNVMGVEKSVATGWKNGRKPQRSNLLKIINFFEVDEKYLIDDTVPVQPGLGARTANKLAGGAEENTSPPAADEKPAPIATEERLWAALDVAQTNMKILTESNATLANSNAKLVERVEEFLKKEAKPPVKNNRPPVAGVVSGNG
jgi:hypothetical protein